MADLSVIKIEGAAYNRDSKQRFHGRILDVNRFHSSLPQCCISFMQHWVVASSRRCGAISFFAAVKTITSALTWLPLPAV